MEKGFSGHYGSNENFVELRNRGLNAFPSVKAEFSYS
jgi:hypothetical protein